MITEIPTAADFQAAGLNQLYLAWQIAMHAVRDFDDVEEIVGLDDEEEQRAASAAYWAKSQPALANAFGLIQQAMEMALKGLIASVSPFLLIPRDPREWPKGVDTGPIPFSEFRTLDAADLFKVHNTFINPPLKEEFRTFWEEVRRDRNKAMHSVSPRSFDPTTLVRALLTAANSLFSEKTWPQQLLDMESDGKYTAYYTDDSSQNVVMQQIYFAVRHLTPAESIGLLGFDKKRRSYLCPTCHDRANRDWQSDWPKLAQFRLKVPGECRLHCIVCEATVEVERLACTDMECEGDVIFEGKCLTCLSEQDSPSNFRSELVDDTLGLANEYHFQYRRGSETSHVTSRLLNDENAQEYGRLSMLAPYLNTWQSVGVYQGWVMRRQREGSDRVLGRWVRTDTGLEWQTEVEPGIVGWMVPS